MILKQAPRDGGAGLSGPSARSADLLRQAEVVAATVTSHLRPGDNLVMEALDWDDPAVEERWCGECRQTVSDYLAKEGLDHGEVGSWPAWHVVPYVSLWAVESVLAPGHVGWWVICGDLPTDYLSAAATEHPRKAMLAFADAWEEVASFMAKGVPHPHVSIRPSGSNAELTSLLENRSDILRRFAQEDSVWGPEYD